MSVKKMAKLLLVIGVSMLGALVAVHVFAAQPGDIGQVANQIKATFIPVTKFITAAAYVAGMGFGVAAIVKFKAHKDNPTQVPISMGIALLFIAAALLYMPTVFRATGQTVFSSSGVVGGTSGMSTF